MNRHRHLIVIIALAAAVSAAADLPGHISYQGMLLDDSTPFTGEATFRFALVDSLTDDYFWTNDGSPGHPDNGIRIPVQDGVFSVLLGAPPMPPIDPSALAGFNQNQALRIWVDVGGHGEVLLGNLPLSSVLFAHQAELARQSAGDFTAQGQISSLSGGFRFPDGTIQETAASGGGECLWTAGIGGNIYYDTGNIGIGTSSPTLPLSIEKSTANNVNPLALVRTTGSGSAAALRFQNALDNHFNLGITGASQLAIGYNANIGLAGDVVRITPAGDVGIGRIDPAAKLDVAGTVRMAGMQLGTSSTAGHVLTTDASGVGTWQPAPAGGESVWINDGEDNIYYDSGNVGIGMTAPDYRLEVGGVADSYNYLRLNSANYAGIFFGDGESSYSGRIYYDHTTDNMRFNTRSGADSAERMRITSTGDVGIGTTSPAARLHVNGTTRMNGFQLGTTTTAGHVLTADANGVGTWQAPPTGGGGDLVLPFAGDASSGGSIFEITNTHATAGTAIEGTGASSGIRGTGTGANSAGVYGWSGTGFGVSGSTNVGKGVNATATQGGTALYAYGNGTGTLNPAAHIENSDSEGVALYATCQSSDANMVVVNRGTGDLLKGYSGPTGNDLVFKVDNNGETSVGVLHITGGSDLAEKFAIDAQAEPGMVVEIDPTSPGKLRIAEGAYNRRVAGVVSGANGIDTGMLLSNLAGESSTQPVALSGRVWVFCDASNQAIDPGDLLTTAPRAGHAMAVSDFNRAHGAVLGKAMTPLAKGQTGMVLTLVNLQ